MSIHEDIQKLFAQVLREHDGNKAAAARSLGINAVTFWGWIEGSRKQKEIIFDAIERAGGRLVMPGEDKAGSATEHELAIVRAKAESLARENELLRKLLSKYEEEKPKD